MDQLRLLAEDKLLLYCSRLNISEGIRDKIKEILSNPLDWNYTVECSMKHGVSPLFYWNLKKINNGKDVPSEAMKNLENMYYSNLARNMLLYDELSKILAAFKKADIDVIVLKGAFLAEQIYKNIGLRPMSDIDLLIQERDIHKAKVELIELRYSSCAYPTHVHEKFQTILNNEASFTHQYKKIVIDIHWDIESRLMPYKVDINSFWKKAKITKIAKVETLSFASEDLLQHLCLHLYKHINNSSAPPAKPLRDYCDIAEVTRYYSETINWNCLLQSSKQYGVEEPIFQGLYIAKKYFGAFVPADVLSALKSIKSGIVFEEIFYGAMKDELKKENQWKEINYLVCLTNIDGTWNKSRIIFGDVFPSKEFMMYRYHIKNEKQVYLYYLIRSATALQWGLAILWQLPNCIVRSAFGK